MLKTAKDKSVAPGAHPSYPDRENFGRRTLDISSTNLRSSLQNQINAIQDAARIAGVSLTHIKPHGALYNDAQDNRTLAGVLVALAQIHHLPLVGMGGSLLSSIAERHKVGFISEAFIDRRYNGDARLVSRKIADAVIENNQDRINQGLALASGKPIQSDTGPDITISAQTLCLHSDSAGALSTARLMREALEQDGFLVKAPSL
ncbi:hypothetical protein HF685_00055 [Parasphingorhabdus halotolerans]|uniref:LamB/YcsF family protein n=1 Tax=Parasphingorhabdus halotolerans TaxID=2725558 RepID=A0A6H2DHP0_9SPHN|nr:LamB/YcsF family protein [Parasphingorhabdus halotolerans]QJB67900.1 hypothetical protein HF685_00055 [Parasphingorhabdus halotolerans]